MSRLLDFSPDARRIASTCPPAGVRIDAHGVRRLLEAHEPELAREPIRLVDEGWDNFTFLVGTEHAVRLPRRASAVALLLNEQRWLPLLAPRLPLAVPVLRHAGLPGQEFRWPWSVVAWIPGDTAEGFHFGRADVDVLAATLRALHLLAPEAAPVNPFRGVPLADRAGAVESRLARLRADRGIDLDRLAGIWRDACAAAKASERRWIHGDLHPRNIIVRHRSLSGVIDWGDVSGGDVATDLACAWTLIADAVTRRRLLDAYDASEAEVLRARGWAVYVGLALADSGEPRHVPLGQAALERVTADV